MKRPKSLTPIRTRKPDTVRKALGMVRPEVMTSGTSTNRRCRVGITTNPEGRKLDWQRQHPSLDHLEILETYDTQQEAQVAETMAVAQCGCESAPGGRDAPGPWYVYRFFYGD